ncbi:MAG: GNAT family N-acetyltransferase [Anaerolineaceae bacterium]|nr:GNAT family N-acetyltransferase [Anaerolineaceae bacterium]
MRDLRSLRVLEELCFELDAWPLIDLIGVLTLPGFIRIKAQIGKELVGFAAGELRPLTRTGWIITLGVLPEFRKQGIALQLIKACEEKIHLSKIRLSVRKSNKAAIRLYAKAGYKFVETWDGYYRGGEDALVLEKNRSLIQGNS